MADTDTTTDPALVAERVTRGVDWLDTNAPGWHRNIALGNLDMNSECACVLGQTFGDYNNAPLFADEARTWPDDEDHISVTHGFNGMFKSDEDGAWLDLAAEWRRVIEKRQQLTVPTNDAEVTGGAS